MSTREWALVAFTLLMQASVGIVVVATAAQPAVVRATAQPAPRLFETPLIVAAVAGALALAASFLHLGQPLQAWLAVGNVRSSWLSREIVSALVFAAALVAFFSLHSMQPGSQASRATAWIAAIAGIVCILAMSELYMTPAQPAWNRLATPASFFATTLLVGIAVVVASASSHAAGDSAGTVVRTLAAVAIALVVIQIVVLVSDLNAIPREPAAAVSSLSATATWWLAAGRALAAIGAALLFVRLLAATPVPVSGGLLLAFIFVSEVLGRVLFYSSSVRFGLR